MTTALEMWSLYIAPPPSEAVLPLNEQSVKTEAAASLDTAPPLTAVLAVNVARVKAGVASAA